VVDPSGILCQRLTRCLPGNPVFQPHLHSGRKVLRVVQRQRGDIDGVGMGGVFIRELAAARPAKPAHHAVRRPIDLGGAGQKLKSRPLDRQPGDRRSRACPAASGAMANTGDQRRSGDAKPNCRAETATLMNLHDRFTCLLRDRCAVRSDTFGTSRKPRLTLRESWNPRVLEYSGQIVIARVLKPGSSSRRWLGSATARSSKDPRKTQTTTRRRATIDRTTQRG